MATNPTSQLAKIIRARAKHFYGLPIKVKQKGDVLTLSIADGRQGEKASEEFDLSKENLRDLFYYEDAPYDYADGVINKFMFPVKALG